MKALILLAAASLVAPALQAEDLPPDTIAAARYVAVTTCANCHGPRGRAIAPKFPTLAAQRPGYLAAQMRAFKAHDRGDADAVAYMWGMAAPLEDDLIAGLAGYYASQPAVAGEKVDGGASARGRVIFEQGVASTGVPACAACHGADGAGMADFPRVAGQSSQYLIKQLRAFRSNLRNAAVMHVMTMALSDADMQDVTAYMAGMGR